MSYFRELPDIEYQSILSDRVSSEEYLTVKNLFRRAKLREDLQNVFTIFNKYQIKDGARPELIAKEIYNSTQFDWVVLIGAGITNVRDQWPLSDRDIYNYAEEIYGENLNNIHHYETIEVKDSRGRLILPAGKIVDESFTIPNLNLLTQNINPVTGVTNYEYEVMKNNKKRIIYVIKPDYLRQIIKDMRNSLLYDQSSQYVDERLIKTENTRNTLI